MEKWDKLSMKDRSKYIQLAVSSGVTDLNDIRNTYNSFAKGGYTKWKQKIREHKGIDIDNDPTYDYEGFYNSNPNIAWDMMNEAKDSHFPDEFKTAIHPTFSNESRYSGNKNRFNPKGITGGTWVDDYTYQLSQDQFNNDWDTDRTLDYLQEAAPYKVGFYGPDGSVILRSITVTPQSYALNRSREANSPNTDFSYAQDMTDIQKFGANKLAGIPLIDLDPHTCLNTVTSFYNPESTVASNDNIVANPEKYGYKQIKQKDAVPGDLIILSDRNNHPNHAVMFDSVSEGYGVHNGYNYEPGDTLVNYSNGGRGSNDYRLQGPLSRFDNPKKAGGDFSGKRTYLRYIGKKNKQKNQ